MGLGWRTDFTVLQTRWFLGRFPTSFDGCCVGSEVGRLCGSLPNQRSGLENLANTYYSSWHTAALFLHAILVMAAVRGRPSGLPGFGGCSGFSSPRTAATLSSGKRKMAVPLHLPMSNFRMIKETPNPPETDDVSPYESPDSKKLNEAAERALDHYLKPTPKKPEGRKPSRMFQVAPTWTTKVCSLMSANPWPRPAS